MQASSGLYGKASAGCGLVGWHAETNLVNNTNWTSTGVTDASRIGRSGLSLIHKLDERKQATIQSPSLAIPVVGSSPLVARKLPSQTTF